MRTHLTPDADADADVDDGVVWGLVGGVAHCLEMPSWVSMMWCLGICFDEGMGMGGCMGKMFTASRR